MSMRFEGITEGGFGTALHQGYIETWRQDTHAIAIVLRILTDESL